VKLPYDAGIAACGRGRPLRSPLPSTAECLYRQAHLMQLPVVAVGALLLLSGPAGEGHRAGPAKEGRATDEVTQQKTKPSSGARQKRARFRALLAAADRGDLRSVRAHLKQGVDPNGRDVGDDWAPTDRPIVVAARGGHLGVVDALLEAGADPNWCCCSCVAALHEAIRMKHAAVVERLLSAGANPHLLYDSTTAPLDLARKTGNREIIESVERRLPRRTRR